MRLAVHGGSPGRALVSVARRDRGIVLTIAVFLVLIASMVGYNVSTTSNQRDTALIVNITARQRTLVERYIKDLLLTLQGIQADPGPSRDVLVSTATVLLDGGKVAAPQGSTDATVTISAVEEPRVRRQLEHARELIFELTTTGDRVLAAGQDSPTYAADVRQMRVLAAQLSSVTGDAAGGVTRNARDSLDEPGARRSDTRIVQRRGRGRDGIAAASGGRSAIGTLPFARPQLGRPHHRDRRAGPGEIPESFV